MLPVLYQLFPNDFHRLVEVFGGGAAVIFGREPGRCEEIYNDYNSNLVTLFWCVKNRPLALMTELNFLPLNSRQEFEVLRKFLREEEFTDAYLREELELCERFFLPPEREELREILLKKAEMSDVRRAAAFYKVIRYSYAGSGTSFGGKPVDIRRGLHQIWECSRRLAEVVIEHQSYEALIPRFNDPATLLYVDPPYYQAECYEVSFGLRDHYRLRELIGQTKSRVVLSYNDCPFIRDLYRDFWVVAVRRNNPMANRYTPGSEYGELVILNYDPRDHPKDRQMTLFAEPEPLLELEYTLVCEGGKTNEESEKTKRPASPQPFSEGHGTGPGEKPAGSSLSRRDPAHPEISQPTGA